MYWHSCTAMLWFASVSASLCTLCVSSLFSLSAAFTVFLRVVDPLQDFQPVWSAVYTPGSPSRLFGKGVGCAPLLKTAHNPVQPPGQFCQLFLTCVHKHTAHSLSFSLRLSLCVRIASNSLHTSPEHAGRINGPSGESWRVARKRGEVQDAV